VSVRRPLAGLLALTLGGCAFLPRISEPLPSRAEVHWAVTQDGWSLHMVRYRPRGPETGLPVLVLHGLAANARNMDLDEDHSVARWLADRGRDTFTLSLRGSGRSDDPSGPKHRSYRYDMDTFATEDLPAALAKVKELSGAASVDVVAHSMGGLVTYIYLARGGTDLNAVVTLGSPARLAWGGRTEFALTRASPFLKPRGNLPIERLTELAMPVYTLLFDEINAPIERLLYNPANIDQETWRKLVEVGLGSISAYVLKQFGLWLQRDSMVSRDGQLDYLELLKDCRTPAMVVAGKIDELAPAPAVRAAFESLGGPKEWFIAGEENGLRHDYGHMDLVLGERAPMELWPRLLRFLAAHAPLGAWGGARG